MRLIFTLLLLYCAWHQSAFADVTLDSGRSFLAAIEQMNGAIGSAPNACPTEEPPSEQALKERLRRQARLSFEEKFAVITDDIEALSDENIEMLTERLKSKRPKFEMYLKEAEEQLNTFDREIELQHETSFSTALKILESNHLFSVDELVRQEKMDPLKKNKGLATKDYIDGAIGEQDVVFLALKPRTGEEVFPFGEVKLKFAKEQTLTKGYFSAFALNSGSPRDENIVPQGLPLYKRMIFQGPDAYESFLKLSIAESLWEKSQNFKKSNAAIFKLQKDHKNQSNGFVNIQGLKGVFESLGQEMGGHKEIPAWMVDQLVSSRIDGPSGRLGKGAQAIGAFHGFPLTENGDPVLLAKNWNFWELKVPRSLPLDSLEAIEVHKSDVSSEQIKVLTQAAQNYASRNNRKLTIQNREDSLKIQVH